MRALEERRRYFIAHGATSADHSHADVRTDPLEPAEAARIYRAALAGAATAGEATAFRRHMLAEMARMSCDDGLVMTLHPGVRRNHHRPTYERFGPDTGHDIPIRIEFTDALRPLLERFGTHPGFHLVAFTVDETVWSRELAPLAGFYPSVYVGRAVVVPRRPRRHPALSRRGDRDGRLLADIGLRRRHPGVLLDPRPARHVPPRRRRASSRGWWPSTGSTRTRPPRPRSTSSPTARPRCSSCERPDGCHERRARAAPPRRCGSCTWGSATSSAPTSAGTPSTPPDAADWGIAAFTGRQPAAWSSELNEQEGLYTLCHARADADRFEVLGSLSRAHAAADHDAWLRYFEAPELCRGHDHGDRGRVPPRRRRRPRHRPPRGPGRHRGAAQRPHRGRCAPLPRAWSPGSRPGGGPARARWRSCPATTRPATARWPSGSSATWPELVDADLAAWLEDSVAVVTTMVDRITPRAAPEDVRTVLEATGLRRPLPGRHRAVSRVGAQRDVPGRAARAGRTPARRSPTTSTPYEQRKLWLLNGAHSLLAYAGSIRGHATVAGAVADETCRSWLEEWWAVASPHLDQPAADIAAYRAALLERFANARMRDRLDRIAADGSQKLPIRILPVLRAERAAGRLPAGATRVLAAWICHLRGARRAGQRRAGHEVVPLAAGPLGMAVPRVLGWLDSGARRRRRRGGDYRRAEQEVRPAGAVR